MLRDRRLCCANLVSLPMSVFTNPAPQGLQQILVHDHSSSNIVAFSLYAGENMILAAWENVECAV
eukprot:1161212-Pelagomonas_calceolata.AAC.9